MPATSIQNGFVSGEVSPSLFGRTDLAKWHQGAFTQRNFFTNYRGGAASRAGFAYVGTCLQRPPAAPPRDIPFQFSLTQGYVLEFGDYYMRIKFRGAYVTEAAKTVSAVTLANPAAIQINAHGFAVNDWLYFSGMSGLTALNGLAWVVASVPDANHVTLNNLFGTPFSGLGQAVYTGGGTVARLYTVAAPYAAVDLPFLKFTQSADTMTLDCVNTRTLAEYPPYELTRHAATNWTFTLDDFDAAITAPSSVAVTADPSTTLSTYYAYVVTAVDALTGEESVASPVGQTQNNDIAVYAGSNTIIWNPVAGAGSYNVYKATPAYNVGVPTGAQFGFMGSALGNTFTDTNITADFTQVPPTHQNPFARGAIKAVTITSPGAGFTTAGYSIGTSTGSGFVGVPILVNGMLQAFEIVNEGQNYAPGDTIGITGGTTYATAALVLGPANGTYPGTVAYHQQRRVQAGSLNNPDTMWFSQPGAFSNMDSSTPVTDSDAIVATPWSQQVNGVQFMVSMPGGLVVLTGKGAWQVNGGQSASITPSDIDATPQAYNGCNDIVAPLTIGYDILYLQSKGSIFRDLSYNFFVNIYTGTDLTVLSNHLFTGHTFSQWCWAEEPYKLAWAVRDDGVMLSLTYLKEQDVYAWARHDTNGLFVGACSITEPPVDAVYVIVKRLVQGEWLYYSERMDNRIWTGAEDCWCVDAGLALPMRSPAAVLTPAAASGTANITSINLITGGAGYTAPVVSAVDPTGAGAGASFTATVAGGVITGIAVTAQGGGYAAASLLTITDTTGIGAVAQPIITNITAFNASAAVFGSGDVGSVIRIGGGTATITGVPSSTQALADITRPITAVMPNDPNNRPVPAVSGAWSLSAPVSVLTGLNHLEGMTVAIVADGSIVPPQVVTNGTITLQHPCSSVLVGLPFTAQLQTAYLDPQGQPMTTQGKRKNIPSVTVRAEASRGLQVGTNQPDASTQPYGNNAPWVGLVEIKERGATVNAGAAIPLFTGDAFVNVATDWQTNGQIAVQQSYPLPANILSVLAWYVIGDSPG